MGTHGLIDFLLVRQSFQQLSGRNPVSRRYTQNILSLPTTPFVVAAINIFSVCPLTIQVA